MTSIQQGAEQRLAIVPAQDSWEGSSQNCVKWPTSFRSGYISFNLKNKVKYDYWNVLDLKY